MKTSISIFSLLMTSLLSAQTLIGAWEWTEKGDEGKDIKAVVTFTEGYQSAAWFDAETGAFISTNGGKWSIEGNTVTELVEFHSSDSSKVGQSISFEIEWKGANKLRIVGEENWMKRVDDSTPGKLNGAWLMSGRKRNGEIQERDTSRPRKTMKILSGTRFQWIAYNTETKKFMGTGGGTYTTIDRKYTENIEFFSRDNSRVGASLDFSYDLIEGKWHHSGKSSKGNPIYEIWSIRN